MSVCLITITIIIIIFVNYIYDVEMENGLSSYAEMDILCSENTLVGLIQTDVLVFGQSKPH